MPQPPQLDPLVIKPTTFSVGVPQTLVIHGDAFSTEKDAGGKYKIVVVLDKLQNSHKENYRPAKIDEVTRTTITITIPKQTFHHQPKASKGDAEVPPHGHPHGPPQSPPPSPDPGMTVTVTNPGGAGTAMQPYPMTFTT